MNLGKNHKIESDSMNVTLYKRGVASTGKNKGTVTWKPLGYYPTVRAALHGLVNHEILDSHLIDLRTIDKRIDAIHALIEEAIKDSK